MKGLFASFTLGAYIRELGYTADASEADRDRLAAAAGLGTLDSSGRLVTRQFGRNVHVADVLLTDLPLQADGGVTYVIAEPCIGEKNGACVDVSRRAASTPRPRRPRTTSTAAYIECEQCVLVPPVDAVFLDKELPDEWRPFEAVNAAFFQANKPLASLELAEATHMLEAVKAYAARADLAVRPWSWTTLERCCCQPPSTPLRRTTRHARPTPR